MRLTGLSGREINIDVFANPEKYIVRLPIDKVIADPEVYAKTSKAHSREHLPAAAVTIVETKKKLERK